MSTTRIIIGRTTARCYSPFEVRDVLRGFPGRRWDPKIKAWIVPTDLVDALVDELRQAGERVVITYADGTPWRSQRRDHQQAGHTSWASVVLDAVGPQRADVVFKALTRVLHLDVGGDTQLMQDLTAARDAQRAMGGVR